MSSAKQTNVISSPMGAIVSSSIEYISISFFFTFSDFIVGTFAIVAGFLISVIAKKNFGVANGDVLGMSNEFGRLIALLFMSVALYFL